MEITIYWFLNKKQRFIPIFFSVKYLDEKPMLDNQKNWIKDYPKALAANAQQEILSQFKNITKWFRHTVLYDVSWGPYDSRISPI